MKVIETRRLLPTMQIHLDFSVKSVVNVELHCEFARVITYDNHTHSHNTYDLPKDSFVKLIKNPFVKTKP